MSYDLAVWEGDAPSSDEEAARQYESLMDQMEAEELGDPTPHIKAHVEAHLARWPDIDQDDDSPWAGSPFMGEASGTLVYFPMVFSRAEEASAFAATLARETLGWSVSTRRWNRSASRAEPMSGQASSLRRMTQRHLAI